MTIKQREHVRRMRIRLAALKRHAAARGRDGKSDLAVAAGRASARGRQDNSAWGLEMSIRRWYGEIESDDTTNRFETEGRAKP